MVNKEEEVNKKFDSIAKAYNDLAQLGSKATDRPAGHHRHAFQGRLVCSRGRKLMGQFLEMRARLQMGGQQGNRKPCAEFEAWPQRRCKPIIG